MVAGKPALCKHSRSDCRSSRLVIRRSRRWRPRLPSTPSKHFLNWSCLSLCASEQLTDEGDEVNLAAPFGDRDDSLPPPLGSTATNRLVVPLRTYSQSCLLGLYGVMWAAALGCDRPKPRDRRAGCRLLRQRHRLHAARRALTAPTSTNKPGTKIIAQMIELRFSLTQVKLPNR